ncbi:MAG TPA: efflux RND transporter periplasmic adaptor subunit [Chthoniobacterales bacterium]|nr:efflux RND transporter periplasmic adaptor subunit [Chthoniobacterales bacterium]
MAGTIIWASVPKVSAPEHTKIAYQPTVAVVTAQPKTLSDFITLQAEFCPYQEIMLHAKVAGYVSAINVDIGDHVNQGELLATLEIPELKDDLNKAEAALRESEQAVIKAEADYRDGDLEYQRLGQVAKQHANLVAQQQLDNAAAKDESARGSLGVARERVAERRAEVGRINSLLAYSKITVPFNGVITNRYADLGSLVQAGTASDTQAKPLVELAEDDLLRLRFPIPEQQTPLIQDGNTVEVTVPALGLVFAGKIARSAWQVDRSTRTMIAEVDVPNVDRKLHAGMYASVKLPLKRERVLAIPVEALSGADNPTVIVLNKQNELEERHVTVGLRTAAEVAINSGLEAGDLVVIGDRSGFRLGDHARAKFVDVSRSNEADNGNG